MGDGELVETEMEAVRVGEEDDAAGGDRRGGDVMGTFKVDVNDVGWLEDSRDGDAGRVGEEVTSTGDEDDEMMSFSR